LADKTIRQASHLPKNYQYLYLIASTTTLRQLNRKKQHVGKLSMQVSCGNQGHLVSFLDIPIEQDNLYDRQRQERPYDSVSHKK